MSGFLESAASVSRALSKLNKAQKLSALAIAQEHLAGKQDPVAAAGSTVSKVLVKLSAEDQKLVTDFVTASVNREDDAAPAGSNVAAAPQAG